MTKPKNPPDKQWAAGEQCLYEAMGYPNMRYHHLTGGASLPGGSTGCDYNPPSAAEMEKGSAAPHNSAKNAKAEGANAYI